jgi:glutamine synthetase
MISYLYIVFIIIMILFKATSIKLLELLLKKLKQLDLYPIIGAEIEFYLSPLDNKLTYKGWQAQKLDLNIIIEEEKGINQFEVRTPHSGDIIACAHEIINLREMIRLQALKQNMFANFSAKPSLHMPGNALHIHLHLENSKRENLYIKQQDKESEIFIHSIGGLCASLKENMLLFAPYMEAYIRYIGGSLESPNKICWGGNNRSAAIRIPIDQKFNRRLEHRVSCSDACPFEVISAILFGILKGINEQIIPPEKLYGNAFLEQYDFPLLPTYGEAKNGFAESELIKLIHKIS